MALQIRRGTDAERLTITPAEGELIYTTDTKLIYIGDGSTLGGTKADSGITDLLSDTSPQLGGNLDLNSQTITGTGTISITGNINGNTVSGSSGNFTSSVIGSLSAASMQGDLTGSVFADDSTMLVDGTDGKIVLSNNVIQDLSDVYVPTTPSAGDALIWNAVDSRWEAGNPAVSGGVFDGDIQGSVFGDDSTLIVDGVNNNITADTMAVFNIVPRGPGGVLVDNNTPGTATIFQVESEGEVPLVNLNRFEPLLDLSLTEDSSTPFLLNSKFDTRTYIGANPGILLGSINFQALDINGTNILGGYINGQNDGIHINHTLDGLKSNDGGIRIVNNRVVLGLFGDPVDEVTIYGDVYTAGTITAPFISANIVGNDSTVILSLQEQAIVLNDGYFRGVIQALGGYEGDVLAKDSSIFYNSNTQEVFAGSATLAGSLDANSVNAGEIKGNIISDDSSVVFDSAASTITAGGFVQFGSYNTTERNALTAVNGMVIYNSQVNRFQGYQNSAWINIDDGTAA
jgi:hypothetical protein